jgi:hypothetical protein
MNLSEISIAIIDGFKKVGYVESIFNDDVYEIWNNSEVRYLSACWELESIETQDDVKAYNLLIFAADRLMENESNKLQCWDAAEQAIETMLNYITENGQSDNLFIEDVRQYTPFKQKFADNLAGVYCRLKLKTPNEINLCT